MVKILRGGGGGKNIPWPLHSKFWVGAMAPWPPGSATPVTYLVTYLVVVYPPAGKVIRDLTTVIESSPSMSWTSCRRIQKPGDCPVSRQETSTSLT